MHNIPLDPRIPPDSFSINVHANNFLHRYGIKCINYDVFSPPKRERKVTIPHRQGGHDANVGGRRFYDDRTITLDLHMTRRITKAEFREIKYELRDRFRIYFWDEPDKFYEVEIYDAADIDVFPGESMREVTLVLNASPTAMRDVVARESEGGIFHPVTYDGTAESPSELIITNNTNHNIDGILLRHYVIRRR